ncbi:MAG: ECF transporter S component [Agathobacter sp.]|nr:ECF transporter S component [Agathobacter sp.]
MKRDEIKKITLSAMFLALAFVLPFFTGQIPQIGNMLCPMHIPVLLCGFFCGAPWGGFVGFIAPILRSMVLGMPPMFPTAICMAFELATYGLVTGLLHNKLPKKRWSVYVSLVSAMIVGRMIWGLAMLFALGLDTTKFGMAAFISGSITTAIPGIVLQIILIPIIVITLERVIGDK